MKKVLVVVDVQKDFYHPEGALYVKGGEVLLERIAKVIPEFDDVIFTVDWHPYNHCSFKNSGGIWPVHCVAYTEGASLPKEFMPYFKEIHDNVCFNIVMKGMNSQKEEYELAGLTPGHAVDEVSFLFLALGSHVPVNGHSEAGHGDSGASATELRISGKASHDGYVV